MDGERKAWELATCVKKFGDLDTATESNLIFFIKLRNKIEHRHIDKREVDTLIFGECQSFLYNYETTLIKLFGEDYSINEALVYSLQFSQIRTSTQDKANKSALSKDLSDIIAFVERYRNTLDETTYNSQEYNIKLIQIPKISNTNRADAAIEFVKWDILNEDDKVSYERLTVLVKDKTVRVEASNVGRLKASEVVKKVNDSLTKKIMTQNLHVVLYKLFKVRPTNGAKDPFETKAEFCLYDETHGDYVYQDSWVEFLINFLNADIYEAGELRQKLKDDGYLELTEYRM